MNHRAQRHCQRAIEMLQNMSFGVGGNSEKATETAIALSWDFKKAFDAIAYSLEQVLDDMIQKSPHRKKQAHDILHEIIKSLGRKEEELEKARDKEKGKRKRKRTDSDTFYVYESGNLIAKGEFDFLRSNLYSLILFDGPQSSVAQYLNTLHDGVEEIDVAFLLQQDSEDLHEGLSRMRDLLDIVKSASKNIIRPYQRREHIPFGRSGELDLVKALTDACSVSMIQTIDATKERVRSKFFSMDPLQMQEYITKYRRLHNKLKNLEAKMHQIKVDERGPETEPGSVFISQTGSKKFRIKLSAMQGHVNDMNSNQIVLGIENVSADVLKKQPYVRTLNAIRDWRKEIEVQFYSDEESDEESDVTDYKEGEYYDKNLDRSEIIRSAFTTSVAMASQPICDWLTEWCNDRTIYCDRYSIAGDAPDPYTKLSYFRTSIFSLGERMQNTYFLAASKRQTQREEPRTFTVHHKHDPKKDNRVALRYDQLPQWLIKADFSNMVQLFHNLEKGRQAVIGVHHIKHQPYESTLQALKDMHEKMERILDSVQMGAREMLNPIVKK